MLETLAGLHEPGVWLQGVDLTLGGRSLAIHGRSLGADAVMRYITQVNEAFKPMGVQFSSMEIAEEAAVADGAGGAKAGLVKFRIF